MSTPASLYVVFRVTAEGISVADIAQTKSAGYLEEHESCLQIHLLLWPGEVRIVTVSGILVQPSWFQRIGTDRRIFRQRLFIRLLKIYQLFQERLGDRLFLSIA